MESFQMTDISNDSCQQTYDFTSDLVDIPCPDDSSIQETNSPPEEIELPLPPGTSGDEFPISFPSKQESLSVFNNLSPSLPLNKDLNDTSNQNHVLESENFDICPLDEEDQGKSDQQNVSSKVDEFLDNPRYSPSKLDSDEENQDFTTTKPKVLGKEQAKKRLMAFSLSKQSNITVKKQNKAFTSLKNKEKPPHPNKSSNVQEQFRATISAIEEEKRKMFHIMPSYLQMEMKELSKAMNSNSASSSELSDKLKSETSDSHRRENSSTTQFKSKIKNSQNRNKNKKRRPSRSRSRSRNRRSDSRNKKRSRSKDRRSRNPTKTKEEKSKEEIVLKRKSCKDWREFKTSGFSVEKDVTHSRFDDSTSRGDKHNKKPNDLPEYKSRIDYKTTGSPKLKSDDFPVLFPNRIIKYTRTKPALSWAENPMYSANYNMSRQALLENCDQAISGILLSIIESKCVIPKLHEEIGETQRKSRVWYPRKDYLTPTVPKTESSVKTNNKSDILVKENKVKPLENENKNENETGTETETETASTEDTNNEPPKSLKRQKSLVNDSYLSEDEKETEKDTTVELKIDVNEIKVRSKWDSDNDEESSEKELERKSNTTEKEKVTPPDRVGKLENLKDKKLENSSLVSQEPSESSNVLENPKESLVSEYEEFLKMVSAEPNDNHKNTPVEKPRKLEKNKKKSSPKSKITDWDQESDFELKANMTKMVFAGSYEGFALHLKESEEEKKLLEKKTRRSKSKKRTTKELKKKKKRSQERSLSEDSSSESSESESESQSDESISQKKTKKKKKSSKTKKKYSKSKDDSYSSDSESEDNKKKKSKSKKKKTKKSNADDSDEIESSILKQLDYKKQLIMKKIEQIDSITDRSFKKREKEKKKEKDSTDDSDLDYKSGKSKKLQDKNYKNSIKKDELSENIKKSKRRDSSSDENTKKKSKKYEKRKKSSESSDSEEKTKSKSNKKTKKKKKSKRSSSSSSSSESEDSEDERKKRKKTKKKEKIEKLEPNLNFTTEIDKKSEKLSWERKETWEKGDKKKKDDDNWETSSSAGEEAEQESKGRERSWDDEIKPSGIEFKPSAFEDDLLKEESKPGVVGSKKSSTDPLEANQLGSETLKTSLSNFSFNENSFCGFGQELSRDFFLADRTESGNFTENSKTTQIDPRPFQSVSKDSDIKKSNDNELYSPGYSDSEASDTEIHKSKRDEVYDPLNCDSEASAEENEINTSPIPEGSDPKLNRNNSTKGQNKLKSLVIKKPTVKSPLQLNFTSDDFAPVVAYEPRVKEEKIDSKKRQLMSVKGQPKLVSKAASVFLDESEEEGESFNTKTENNQENGGKENRESKNTEKVYSETQKSEVNKRRRDSRSKSKERSTDRDREGKRRRSRTRSRSWSRNRSRSRDRDRRRSNKSSKKSASPKRKIKSRTPEIKKEKREIRSDSFEIEPLKGSIDPDELAEDAHPIPVVGRVQPLSEWNRPLSTKCEFQTTVNIDNAESFDIYPNEDSKHSSKGYGYDRSSVEKSKDSKSKRERRKSRSRSYSPRKRRKSKTPDRRRSRSPRRKSSLSPRRSPKRKSSPRRYKTSRSPDKKRKSPSRSPRRRRGSPRRSRSLSPRKYKHRDDSPRRRNSPVRTFSPVDHFPNPVTSQYSDGMQKPIPVIGTEDVDMDLSPSSLLPNSMEFPPDPSVVSESNMYQSFYENEYSDGYGMNSYPEEVGVNNLITVKNHDIERVNSPERLSLDQRIELELNAARSGSQVSGDQYPIPPPFQEINPGHFQNSYNCDNTDNFYHNQPMNADFNGSVQVNPEYNGQYFNGHQQPPPQNFVPFQQYPNSQPVQPSVLQVGNIVEVIPSLQHPPPPPPPPKTPQIMQVGNVLQVVPSQKVNPPVPSPVSHGFGLPDAPPTMKTQKATAVVAPSSIVPTPNPDLILNPLIKAIQLEREKRMKEKEKRKAEREARRKARELRREAKLLSVNEKLKKSVENEGLMLGQEVEDDELLDATDVPSPPVPVEIITVSSPSALPPAGKGILITAGFMPKPPSEKKEVKFADGVCPGEGTSTSGEDVASPPPKPKLPKEKRFRKKKTRVKKKVKVEIIKQIIHEEDEDDEDLSPPPPPPGDPPPVFFARFPYSDSQFPVYQTQTTTTTTTIQYPAQAFE